MSFKRILARVALTLGGLWLLAVAGLGIAYHHSGWKRLEILPTPSAVALGAEFRPYSEHEKVLPGLRWPYVIRLESTPEDGAVLFFGSGHTRDPDDPQIARIIELWKDFRPTMALCESRLGLYIGGMRKGVAEFGEVAVAYALARDTELPVYSLEPDDEDEKGAMLERFSPPEVVAFYTLRGFMSERDGQSGKALDRVASGMVKKRGKLPGGDRPFSDLNAFEAWWDENLRQEMGDWRSLPDQAMWPGVENETLLTRLANASNRIRDEHMVKVVIDLAHRGERVFVICGGSHALSIEPALRRGMPGT